jgi:hypothetical protein
VNESLDIMYTVYEIYIHIFTIMKEKINVGQGEMCTQGASLFTFCYSPRSASGKNQDLITSYFFPEFNAMLNT